MPQFSLAFKRLSVSGESRLPAPMRELQPEKPRSDMDVLRLERGDLRLAFLWGSIIVWRTFFAAWRLEPGDVTRMSSSLPDLSFR